MSFCPNCGHELYAGMNFCPGCGRNLADLVGYDRSDAKDLVKSAPVAGTPAPEKAPAVLPEVPAAEGRAVPADGKQQKTAPGLPVRGLLSLSKNLWGFPTEPLRPLRAPSGHTAPAVKCFLHSEAAQKTDSICLRCSAQILRSFFHKRSSPRTSRPGAVWKFWIIF